MTRWLGVHFLLAGLSLSSCAPTADECRPSLTPVPLADPSVMIGKWNFFTGYTNHEAFNSILKVTGSSWLNMSSFPGEANKIGIYEENRIKGTCFSATMNATISDDTVTTSMANITSRFQVLPSCDGCLVLSINTTARDLNQFFTLFKINTTVTDEEINVHSLYLMGKEESVKDADLADFKKQASCLGFSEEPHFHTNPVKDVCKEGEGVKMM